MANLIKVTRLKDKEGVRENKFTTFDGLLKSIFPDMPIEHKYNGVRFGSLDDGTWYPKLTGIRIEAGSYSNTLRRRVMIKDEHIDADAVRQKYEECRKHAEADEKLVKQAQEHHERVLQAYDQVLRELGIKDRWATYIHYHSPTAVKISGTTDWQRLKEVGDILNEPIKTSLNLIVPIEHAKRVYEILHPPEENK